MIKYIFVVLGGTCMFSLYLIRTRIFCWATLVQRVFCAFHGKPGKPILIELFAFIYTFMRKLDDTLNYESHFGNKVALTMSYSSVYSMAK